MGRDAKTSGHMSASHESGAELHLLLHGR